MKRALFSAAIIFMLSIPAANPCYAIKIGIQTGVDKIGIGASAETSLIDANTNKTVMTFEAMKGYEIIPYKNTMAIALKGKFYQIYSDYVVLKAPPGGFVSAKGKWYRGLLIIQNKNKKAFIIGAGNLGTAIANYGNFTDYGLNIIALFDNDPKKIGKIINGMDIKNISELPEIAKNNEVDIAILTVPRQFAQTTADFLVKSNISYIWNFAPVVLSVPNNVQVWNENLMGNFLQFTYDI